MQQVSVIKDGNGNVLTLEDSVPKRWKEYFVELMNEDNKKERRTWGGKLVNQEEQGISTEEIRAAMKRMKCGKTVGPDNIRGKVQRCTVGETPVDFITRFFNAILESAQRMYKKKFTDTDFRERG